MERIGGATGALWIALVVVLAGATVAGSLRARRAGSEPGEWTLLLPGAVALIAVSFVLLRMIVSLEPQDDRPVETEAVPQLVPGWAFAETTATIAGIVAGLAAATWVVCFFLRGRMQHRLAVEADEAILRHRRDESASE